MLIPAHTGATNDRDTGLASINVYGMVHSFLVESDVRHLVVSSVGGNFCGIERMDVVDNAVQRSNQRSTSTNAETWLTHQPSRWQKYMSSMTSESLEPPGLVFDKLWWHEAFGLDAVHDGFHLLLLALKFRGYITRATCTFLWDNSWG